MIIGACRACVKACVSTGVADCSVPVSVAAGVAAGVGNCGVDHVTAGVADNGVDRGVGLAVGKSKKFLSVCSALFAMVILVSPRGFVSSPVFVVVTMRPRCISMSMGIVMSMA